MKSSGKIDDLLLQLQQLAQAARYEGDDEAARALERSMLELRSDAHMIATASSGVSFGSSASGTLDVDMARWALLRPKSICAREDFATVDCGRRGRITIIGGSILIKGSVAHEPLTAMLIADYAKRHHKGGGTAFGAPEFLRNIAIANITSGTTIQCRQPSGSLLTELRLTASGWAPMLAAIRAAAPARPSGHTQPTATIEVPTTR